MWVLRCAVCVVKGSPISVHSVAPALSRLPLARCKEEMVIKHLNTVSNSTFSSLLLNFVSFLLRSEPEAPNVHHSYIGMDRISALTQDVIHSRTLINGTLD